MAPLNDMNPVGRFSDRADDYVRYRPTYPAPAIDAILNGLALPGRRVMAADVGAGTGISARLLGDRGVRVVAVEPGVEMRQAATSHTNVWWVSALAEATGLRAGSFDLVLCAQSFHWFRANEAVREFAGILRPHGRLAIVWNRRSYSDALTVGYRRAIVEAGGDSIAERMDFDPAVIGLSGSFAPAQRCSFSNFQRLDLEGLIGRARSASYVPKTGTASQQLLDALCALHSTHADGDGLVTLVYESEVYLATRMD